MPIVPFLPMIASGVGSLVSHASQSAAKNRGAETLANQQGQTEFEKALMNRAMVADKQREGAFGDMQKADYLQNWQPSQRAAGVPNISFVRAPGAALLKSTADLQNTAAARLAGPDNYNINAQPKLSMIGAQKPSAWEKLGGFLGPALGVAGAAASKRFGQSSGGSDNTDWAGPINLDDEYQDVG